ncbi:CPBP family intramembrane glutamic endopeptidase [Pelagicoccus sp. SDUM812005]|uniref:CPBP family intramembrane glutamic endopeptidase n=1 Tax=Pelagicoccus sp. SDUM812005 TaxID=3041257 RepID=UPI00280D70D6|nr:CPBP family intramembrane glutamic endopeptidase [Pelagicoccus sp. SDUM812005]MDQ8183350.1 CPBP family intramembrane metalloprotease [Pelagicoccus sp. SDUM812005]
MKEPLELSRPWRRLFPTPLSLVLVLFVVLTGFRAYGYFGSDLLQGPPIMIGFVLMWFVPLVFLTRYGREQIGLHQPFSYRWLLLGILLGAAAAAFCYLLGLLLYGKSDQHWFVSVAYAFQTDERIAQLPRHIAFIAFTVPAMLASPIGEEIFFRGVTEEANRDRLSGRGAACFAAALFALAHLIHHGIYRGQNGIEVMPVSGAIWFALMFATSLLFSYLRRKGQSIWTAIAAHAAFNLVMNVTIFYSLFVSTPRTH